MTFQYECTPEEVSRAQSVVLRAGYGAANSKWKFWAIMLVIISVLGYRFYDEILRERNWEWVGVFLIAWMVFFIRARSASKRQRSLDQKTTVTVSEEGIQFTTRQENAFIPYGDIADVMETDEFVLLKRRSGNFYHYIPNRAFSGYDVLKQILTAMRERIRHAVPASALKFDQPVMGVGSKQLKFTHTYVNCLDITIASWITRGIVLCVIGIVIFISYQEATKQSPDVSWKVGAVIGIVTSTWISGIFVFMQSWKLCSIYKKRGQPEMITIGSEGLYVATGAGCESIAWDRLTHFKESFCTFILWQRGMPLWLTIPKSACSDQSEIESVRQIFSSRLQASTWFAR